MTVSTRTRRAVAEVPKEPEVSKPPILATASTGFVEGGVGLFGGGFNGFYMPNSVDSLNQALGNSPDKLIVPKDYHATIRMCYDFYQRGGIASVVVNRLAELSITTVRNGQRANTSDEANTYYDAVLHRKPSRLYRFINSIALEYFLSGLVLPRVDWELIPGSEISPELKATKDYWMPVFDWYAPTLVDIVWAGWGEKQFWLRLPSSDITLIRKNGSKIKAQQMRFDMMLANFPTFVQAIQSGADRVQITDSDPILRKQVAFTPYPTPFMMNVLEALIFKQQIRRMDYAVASRVINAILLIQEGDKDFPLVQENRGNLDQLKQQILGRQNNPALQERVFELFSNHTTKMTWISPDVKAMLDQQKYQQANTEISEGLGFSQLLITGESRNAQASELSTYAIQPQMEEIRTMILEWMQGVYELAGEKNKFRNIPTASMTPVKLQDVVKTAAIFAQAFKEGNISRTTRDEQLGLNFPAEVELMRDELENMKELPKSFPDMPYNVQVVPGGAFGGTGIGRPPGAPVGGRPVGTQNPAVNNRRSGVKLPGQAPVSRVKVASAGIDKLELMEDEALIELLDKVAIEHNIYITIDDIEDGAQKT